MFRHLATSLFRKLPPETRERIKRTIGAGGHSQSFANSWRALRLAENSKHPDRLLPSILQVLNATGRKSLDGCTVLDYGSGYLLADAFLYSMLGASTVHAVDYDRLLEERHMREYVRKFDWERYLASTVPLTGERDVASWKEKLEFALADTSPEWYRHLGIEYQAPFDALSDSRPIQYDLVVSRSTLEHVPPHTAPEILSRLGGWVRPGGNMYHFIHLADHRDTKGNPLAFLSQSDNYSEDQFDIRGNRMRASDWSTVFSGLQEFEFSEVCNRAPLSMLPETLAPPFEAYSAEDLAVTHYTVWGVKSKCATT